MSLSSSFKNYNLFDLDSEFAQLSSSPQATPLKITRGGFETSNTSQCNDKLSIQNHGGYSKGISTAILKTREKKIPPKESNPLPAPLKENQSRYVPLSASPHYSSNNFREDLGLSSSFREDVGLVKIIDQQPTIQNYM
jgi:hypothetical protein